MKKTKIKTEYTKTTYGWTKWIYPLPNYLLKCCDCGLVHEMQFKTFVEKKKGKDTFEVIPLPSIIRPMFRARRSKIK